MCSEMTYNNIYFSTYLKAIGMDPGWREGEAIVLYGHINYISLTNLKQGDL
jgi:hypothetical protein